MVERGTLLERYRDHLPMIFIVSQVSLQRAAGEGSDLEIEVKRAAGHKCARCWRMVPSVSADPDTAGLCDRCVEAVAGQGAAGGRVKSA